MIHSPLVGPLTLTPLAGELRDQGFDVSVPDLRAALAAPRPQWRAILDSAIAAAGDVPTDIVIGHSGAGVLLPLLAEQLNPEVVAYVDAVVPGNTASYEASREFIEFIDSLPRTGQLLPPWHTWWGDAVMVRLLPDEELRGRTVADTPSVPRSFYDDPVPLPSGWSTRRGCCFLQLSPAYDDDRARAESYGWPAAATNGQHLDVAAKPAAVAHILIDLIDRAQN